MLTLTRDLIALRTSCPGLNRGPYRSLEASPGAWAWERGDGIVVLANMTDAEGVLAGVDATVRIASDRRLDGQRVNGTLRLPGWEAAVVERG
jgi:hypothetical protein